MTLVFDWSEVQRIIQIVNLRLSLKDRESRQKSLSLPMEKLVEKLVEKPVKKPVEKPVEKSR